MATGDFRVHVPVFDNTIAGYDELRKRARLFQARMKLEGKPKQSALLLLGSLTGIAWDTCESLSDDPKALEEEKAFDVLMDMLDKRFKHDKSTELPEAFEEYFYKANRKNKETLFDYIGRTRLSTKKIHEHKIDLPDKVRGWLLLHRAGLSEEQKTLVMSQVGTDFSFDKVASVLQTTFGEKQVPSESRNTRRLCILPQTSGTKRTTTTPKILKITTTASGRKNLRRRRVRIRRVARR